MSPRPWHVNPVSPDDDRRLREIMARRHEQTGEYVTKAGTLKRAVRALWESEVNNDDVNG
jgi:hypothetical protein